VKRAASILMIGIFLAAPINAWAGEAELMQKIEMLEARLRTLEIRAEEQNSCIAIQAKMNECQETTLKDQRKRIEEMAGSALAARPERNGLKVGGFEIGAGVTMVGQYAIGANADESDSRTNMCDGTMTVDIGITRQIEDFGKAFLHLEYGQEGAYGVENDITAYPFTNVNYDANADGFRISEAWYEHYLFDKKLTITGGKVDPTIYFDGNAVANDETTQFLNRAFRNNPTIEFPEDNSLGMQTTFIPYEWCYLSTGFFEADANWENFFNNLFGVVEVGFSPKFFGRDDNYRFILWGNNNNHEKLTDVEMNKRHNYGWALSFDEKVTENVTVFSRLGMQNSLVSDVRTAWSAGAQVAGKLWKREDDVLGLAFGQAIPGRDYKIANSTYNARWQTSFEVYYKFKVNEYLALSPDFQVIWDPNGIDPLSRKGPVEVLGLRGQIDF